jgi:uncharacterized membrane protein
MYYVQALIINALIIMIIPRVLTKPIGVPVIDEFVVYLKAQQAFLVASSLLLALTMYLTNYWVEYAAKSEGPMSPKSPFVKE